MIIDEQDRFWTSNALNFRVSFRFTVGSKKMRRKLCICSEISRKAVMICKVLSLGCWCPPSCKVLSLGCWCPPSLCKQQRISHCTGYTRLFDVNFTTKVTHSRTYLQSNKIAEKKSILNFGFTSPLRPSKDRTVVMDGDALATSSQLNHDTSLQFFDILQ